MTSKIWDPLQFSSGMHSEDVASILLPQIQLSETRGSHAEKNVKPTFSLQHLRSL